MTKLRARAGAVMAAAAIVTTGSAVGVTVVTAGPAQAFTCHQGLVSNGKDYLDDYGGGSGKYVHTYPYTDSPNQQWCLEVASQGGYHFHPANNYGLCLDAHTSTLASRSGFIPVTGPCRSGGAGTGQRDTS